MHSYKKEKALNAFTPVRVLSGKDLYFRYGERVPRDKADFVGFSRNPLEKMDMATSNARSSFNEDEYLEYARMQAEESRETQQETEDSSESD